MTIHRLLCDYEYGLKDEDQRRNEPWEQEITISDERGDIYCIYPFRYICAYVGRLDAGTNYEMVSLKRYNL